MIPSRSSELEEKAADYRQKRNEKEQQISIPSHREKPLIQTTTSKKLVVAKRSSYTLLGYGSIALVLAGSVFAYSIFSERQGQLPPEPPPTESEIKYFFNDESAFNLASNFPPVMVDFDDMTPGTDLTGVNVNRVRFDKINPSTATPMAVDSRATFVPTGFRCEPIGEPSAHRLYASSAGMILSPGGTELAPGPNPAIEDDDLVLIFEKPVSAIGLNVLWQSMTGSARTLYAYDANGKTLFSQKFSLYSGTP